MQIIPQQIVFTITECELLVQFIRDVVIPHEPKHAAHEEVIDEVNKKIQQMPPQSFTLVGNFIYIPAKSAAFQSVGICLNDFLAYIDNVVPKGHFKAKE